MSGAPPPLPIAKHRLETLADGVFAIVMTLLVLELLGGRLGEAKSADELNRALFALWPKAVSFIISFCVTGVFWFGHHTEFRYTTHTNSHHIWINILFLLCISFLPFLTALLGEHYSYQTAIVVYGINLIVASGVMYWNWCYVTTGRRLVAQDLDENIVKSIKRRLLIGPILYGGTILVSFWNPTASFVLYILTAMGYVLSQILPGVVNPIAPPNSKRSQV